MPLKQGIYEQLITQDLKQKLKDFNINQYLIEKEQLDVEEAKTVLTAYFSAVVKKLSALYERTIKKMIKRLYFLN